MKVLSLDGGHGGLFILYLIRRLTQAIDNKKPPKPCEVFDYIGGSGTGGVVAILLGRLEMEIDEAIRAYIGLTDDVFLTPPWYKALWHKFCPKQPLFNSTKLMDAAKKIVIERNLAEDTLFLQNDSSCKTLVCVCDANARELVFKDYPTTQSWLDQDVTIWAAAASTIATLGWFNPIPVTRKQLPEQRYYSSIHNNNPADTILYEVSHPEKIKVFVSIGGNLRLQYTNSPASQNDYYIRQSELALHPNTEADKLRRYQQGLFAKMSYYRISPLTTTNDISTNPPALLAALKEVAKFSENSDARANLERCGHELLELTRPIICRDDIDVKFTV